MGAIVKNNPPLPGKSMLSILKGETRIPHSNMYFMLIDHDGLRKGNWKISRVDGKNWELLNLATDRTESTDLSNQYPDKKAELINDFNAWLEETNMQNYTPSTDESRQMDDRRGEAMYIPSEIL